MTESENVGNKALIGIFLIGIIAIIYLVLKNNMNDKIIENGNETVGIITEYSFSNYVYILKYEYYVENQKFERSISTNFFECNDGTKGCEGKEFKILYLDENPNKSIIDLGIYNKYKNY